MSSHGVEHIEAVRKAAADLCRRYAPDLLELADAAALWHDKGHTVDPDTHEVIGEQMVLASPELLARFGFSGRALIADAVRQHRATTGRPVTTLAKILSDADRIGIAPGFNQVRRAYLYRLEHGETDTAKALKEAGEHIASKYAPGAYGRKAYFPHSMRVLSRTYSPILKAITEGRVTQFIQ